MLTLRDLERILIEILAAIKPSPTDRRDRNRLIQKLQEVVDSSSIRGASVEPFGSFVSQLFTRWGDLDISINLPNQLSHNTNVEILEYLDMILPEKDGWHNKELISLARVPILKFDQESISCDVSIDNLSGQVKSKLLRLISEMDERFHDMVLLIKEWAKANDINDPKSGTLNSYCLSLLVIFHFQTCEPVILPPLKIISPGSAVDDLDNIGSETAAMQRMTETCAANIDSWRTNPSRAINRSSLSELFISFMDKFKDLTVKAANYRINTSTGTWKEKWFSSRKKNYNRNSILIVEDPFEHKENAARTVRYGSNILKISDAFESTITSIRGLSSDRLLARIATPRVNREIISNRLSSRSSSSSSLHR